MVAGHGLGLAPDVKPDMLKRIEKWLLAPDLPITPGWRYDEDTKNFVPPARA